MLVSKAMAPGLFLPIHLTSLTDQVSRQALLWPKGSHRASDRAY